MEGCLDALLSLTPKSPWANTYNPANPAGPWAVAELDTYGGQTYGDVSALWPTLAGQCADNEILVGGEPAGLDDTTSPMGSLYPTGGGAAIAFTNRNIPDDHQFLFLFTLAGHSASDIYAQFFVNHSWVRTEKLAATIDTKVAILVDAPLTHPWAWLFVRIAGEKTGTPLLAIKRMDCYLL
jgi:hypothetical protein